MDTGDVDVTKRSDVDQLKGNAVGLYSILFLCVTGSAPLAVFVYNTPYTMPFGSGKGGPAAFLFATIVLTFFSIAYAQMAKKVRAAGGMYTYVSHGLGQSLGTDGRLLADGRLRDLRRRAAGRLLVVRPGQVAAVLGHPDQLAVVRADRRGAGRVPGLLRRRDLGEGARARADQRDRDHRDLVDLPLRPLQGRLRRARPALERPRPTASRRASACSSRSGRGSASRPRRTTPRRPRIPSR